MKSQFQLNCVQQVLCLQRKHNLDSRDQQPCGLLNTCLKRCDALGLSLWNLPSPANARLGLFPFLLNRKTALCHRFSRNIRGAPLGVEPAVRARENRNTHRPTVKENAKPLIEACGFPFLSHFRSDNSHMKRPRAAPFFFGGSSLSFALSFPFNFTCIWLWFRFQYRTLSSTT